MDGILLSINRLRASATHEGLWYVVYSKALVIILTPSAGIRSPEQQRAWREKIGLVSIILVLMAGVGYITFGFTQSVCGTPANRYHGGAIGTQFIGNSSVTINGMDYDFSTFKHPNAGPFNGQSNPIDEGGWNLAGNDASFLFQKVNQHCLGILTKGKDSTITGSGNTMDWYFPCNIKPQSGTTTPNTTASGSGTNCHSSSTARSDFASMHALGQVYYTWDDVRNTGRNLAVYETCVIFSFASVGILI